MRPISFSSISFFLLLTSITSAQVSGNSGYGSTYDFGKQPSAERLFLSDSTFIVEASVAMNVLADTYVATFGLADEGSTLKECNDKIDKRIQSFTADLVKKGIAQSDLYVDMTAQNKIYDYKTDENTAEQYLKGFEIKKNVIVRLKSPKDLDDVIVMAASYQIYDLVKVDYIVTDLARVHDQLFQTAAGIMQQKKTMYASLTNATLAPSSEVYNEQFYSYYPDDLYKSYTAYESSDVYSNNYSNDNNLVKKDIRKSATIYYDKMNYSGFDQVINPIVTEPAVEFILTLDVKFQIVKK